ncbi:T9SS type A sorting domain-containing protein [Chitinophagaceae bacterium MMS25-I14]
MKKLITFLLVLVCTNVFATINYLGYTKTGTTLTVWFFANTSFGQGLMAQVEYDPATYTGFVAGSFDNTNGPAGSNYRVDFPIVASTTGGSGALPAVATNLVAEAAKADYGTTNNGTEYTGVVFPVGTALALRLLAFDAVPGGNSVLISWKAGADASGRFTVQRSSNGVAYSDIHTEVAIGVAVTYYSFTDESSVPGVNYYRLKMTDPDGTITYSKVVTADCAGKISVQITPNPTHDFIVLKNIAACSIINITDISGRLCIHETTDAGSTKTIDLRQALLNGGTYFVRVQTGGNTVYTGKILFIK